MHTTRNEYHGFRLHPAGKYCAVQDLTSAYIDYAFQSLHIEHVSRPKEVSRVAGQNQRRTLED